MKRFRNIDILLLIFFFVRGQWHGDVDVHIFEDLSRTERKRFWQDITRLMMTRHENIALFMGVCVNPPNFAIVTR